MHRNVIGLQGVRFAGCNIPQTNKLARLVVLSCRIRPNDFVRLTRLWNWIDHQDTSELMWNMMARCHPYAFSHGINDFPFAYDFDYAYELDSHGW